MKIQYARYINSPHFSLQGSVATMAKGKKKTENPKIRTKTDKK